MSSRKDEGELQSHLADLMVYSAFLVVILLAIQLGCVDLELPFGMEPMESPGETLSNERVLEAVRERNMLCSASMDMEVLLSRKDISRRFLLPDGYTDVAARIPGSVRASVNLDNLRNGDLSVSRIGPLVSVGVRLPRAEVSSVRIDYSGIRWNHSSDWLQVFRADARALIIRAELIAEARRILPERAVQAGLFLEAERHAADVIRETGYSLGADRVEITFAEGGAKC